MIPEAGGFGLLHYAGVDSVVEGVGDSACWISVVKMSVETYQYLRFRLYRVNYLIFNSIFNLIFNFNIRPLRTHIETYLIFNTINLSPIVRK